MSLHILEPQSLAALKVELALALSSSASAGELSVSRGPSASGQLLPKLPPSLSAPETRPHVVLVLPSGAVVANPNVIVAHLFRESIQPHVAHWLQLEETKLFPALALALTSGAHLPTLEALLGTINTALAAAPAQPALSLVHAKQSLTSADVVVASTLYAAFAPAFKLLSPTLKLRFPALDSFLQTRVYSLEAFATALQKADLKASDESAFAQLVAKQSTPLDRLALQHAAADAITNPRAAAPSSSPAAASSSSADPDAVTLQPASAEEIAEAVSQWRDSATNFKPLAGEVGSDPSVPRPNQVLLPKEGQRNILITSALPYVNNVPHLGNIIGCVLSADVYARFCRERGYNTLYVCGTDEYGTATETKALEEGLTPQQICDKYHKLHREIYEHFQISFDKFGRTTTPEQTQIAQDIFLRALKNNQLIEDSVEQLLCEKCDRYLADRFVEGTCPSCKYEDARGDQCDKCGKLLNAVELVNPRCKLCGTRPVIKQSRHLFLNLPQLEDKLKKWTVESAEKGDWSASGRHITAQWLKEGVKPRCITRDLKWGTPVPLDGFREKVFYVWFDAPIGYLSITATYTKEWEKWWKNPSQVQLYQFMAKDNVPFHTIIFPASLIAADDNYTLLHHVNSVDFLNYEDGKFSKSRGVGVFGNHVVDTKLDVDLFRFYLLYVRPESCDSVFSWNDMVAKVNGDLVNNLGNFINRSLSFIKNNFGGKVPKIVLDDKVDYDACNFVALVNRQYKAFVETLEAVKLRDGIRLILGFCRIANQYMQLVEPWKLIKKAATDENAAIRTANCLGLCANFSHLIASILFPYTPSTSKRILQQLNAPPGSLANSHFVLALPEGHEIGTPAPLFEKIEPAVAEALRKRYAGKQSDSDGSSTVVASVTESAALKRAGKSAATATATAPSTAQPANPGAVKELEARVAAQGEVVRKLKAEKADKGAIDAQVKVLLELKAQLAALNPTAAAAAAAPAASSSGKKK